MVLCVNCIRVIAETSTTLTTTPLLIDELRVVVFIATIAVYYWIKFLYYRASISKRILYHIFS